MGSVQELKRKPDQDIISELKYLLSQAENGELLSLMYIVKTQTQTYKARHTGTKSVCEDLGMIELMKQDYMESIK